MMEDECQAHQNCKERMLMTSGVHREHYHEGGAIALLLPRKEGLHVLDRHKSLKT